MKAKVNFRGLAITPGVAVIPGYVLCILGGEFLGWHMCQSWAPLLPGFTWPVTVGGFVTGLLCLVVYSVYFAAIVAFPYNFVLGRRQQET
jgi:hypothetical protein